ncbi:MAG: SpoIIE family protein phosphatase [Planctomycetes bacterium]|nr:SpoIIE family protein phosphatase [Planctomycetota bacterium]
MRIVVLDDNEVIRDQTFSTGPISLGSDARANIHLPNLAVHLEHLRLDTSGTGQWNVESAAPTATATVNGRRLQQRCPVFNGDQIAVGPFVLQVILGDDGAFGPTGKTSLDALARIKEFPLPRGGEVRKADQPITLDPERLHGLAGFAHELVCCQEIEALMDRTLAHLLQVLPIRTAWFGLRRQPHGDLELMEGRNSDGSTGTEPPMLPTFEYRCVERGQCLRLRKAERGGSALVVPLEARRGRLGLLYVQSKRQGAVGHAQLDMLYAIGLHVAARLEAVLMGTLQRRVEKAALTTDWTVLREVQSQLDPPNLPTWPGCQLAVFRKPGLERGGDAYDAMTMPNGMAAMMVGTVEADPVPGSVAVTQVHTAFRVAGLHGDPPKTLLRELNWLLAGTGADSRLSVAHVVLNPKNGAFEYCIAGPTGALIMDTSGRHRELAVLQAEPLNARKSSDFKRCSDRLVAGETLALFSCGCLQLTDESRQPVPRERFVEILREGAGLAPTDALEELQHELAGFFKNGRQPDDITVLLLRRV